MSLRFFFKAALKLVQLCCFSLTKSDPGVRQRSAGHVLECPESRSVPWPDVHSTTLDPSREESPGGAPGKSW